MVRHGRTTANARGLLLGRTDLPLDERGEREAAAVAGVIASGRFGEVAEVVSSPLLRTRQTAEAVAAAVGRTVVLDDRFIELDYGSFEGTPVADIAPAVWSRWRTELDFAPEGGESIATLGVRVRAACIDWSSAGRDGQGEVPGDGLPDLSSARGAVVVVSHVSPIKAAVAWSLGVGDEVAWRTHLDTASITRIGSRGGVPVLSSFNDTAHLAALDS